MPVKSNAVVRAMVWSEPEAKEYEIRIFKCPDGNFTKGDYDHDDVPDTGHKGDLLPIDADDIELVFKILTGKEFVV